MVDHSVEGQAQQSQAENVPPPLGARSANGVAVRQPRQELLTPVGLYWYIAAFTQPSTRVQDLVAYVVIIVWSMGKSRPCSLSHKVQPGTSAVVDVITGGMRKVQQFHVLAPAEHLLVCPAERLRTAYCTCTMYLSRYSGGCPAVLSTPGFSAEVLLPGRSTVHDT